MRSRVRWNQPLRSRTRVRRHEEAAMTQAVAVRRDGDTFQARQFWLRAARLLDPKSCIRRVGFESGPKGFDDIWVEYEPGREPSAHDGVPLQREHLQCKWHVAPGTYGYADLIAPEFINANARSLLQRAHDAQVKYAPEGRGARFKLVTNWQLDRGDPLGRMINNRSGSIRQERLYGSKTDNSKEGAVRKAWREHLGIDEDELRVLARTLAFGHVSETLEDLRERLDEVFSVVGLLRVGSNQTALVYDDLVFQWMAQGRLDFDRKTFREACRREDLLRQSEDRPRVYGVKSFEHAFDRLEERCDDVLDLVPVFDERYIRSDADWEAKIYPELQAFLRLAARERSRLRLALDAHTTLAFAAGSVLNIKSGRDVELEQRTLGRHVWAADDVEQNPNWSTLRETLQDLGRDQVDLAVALSITHDIAGDVRDYVDAHLHSVGRLLSLKPATGPNAQAVAAGRHAFELVQAAKEAIRRAKLRIAQGGTTHIFVAAPNAFTFFLGQQQSVLGRVRLYEFDFEGGRGGSYSASLTLPIPQS